LKLSARGSRLKRGTRKSKTTASDAAADVALAYLRQVTHPTRWDEMAPFRETFTRYFPSAIVDEFRGLGRKLFGIVFEGVSSSVSPVSPSQTELQAVSADFRYLESYLAGLCRSIIESDTQSPRELELASFLAKLAAEVGSMAVAVDHHAALAASEEMSDA
jgi:hypothetical protein